MTYLYWYALSNEEVLLCDTCATLKELQEYHQIDKPTLADDVCATCGAKVNYVYTYSPALFARQDLEITKHNLIHFVTVCDELRRGLEIPDPRFEVREECALSELALLTALDCDLQSLVDSSVLWPADKDIVVPIDHTLLHELAHIIFRLGVLWGAYMQKTGQKISSDFNVDKV